MPCDEKRLCKPGASCAEKRKRLPQKGDTDGNYYGRKEETKEKERAKPRCYASENTPKKANKAMKTHVKDSEYRPGNGDRKYKRVKKEL